MKPEPTVNQRHWLELLAQVEPSGLSLSEFAKKQGMSVQTLYSWKSQLVKKGLLPGARAKSFAKVRQRPGTVDAKPSTPTNQDQPVKVVLPNGISVELPS